MNAVNRDPGELRRIRGLILFFIGALAFSGLTAIPLRWGAGLLDAWFGPQTWAGALWPPLGAWIGHVATGIEATASAHPFMFYGTDWLAFGHIVIALAFLGPLRDPVRNIWVIQLGLIASLLVIPWAFIFGPLRGIPLWWRLIDSAFGVGGLLALWPTYRLIRRYAAS